MRHRLLIMLMLPFTWACQGGYSNKTDDGPRSDADSLTGTAQVTAVPSMDKYRQFYHHDEGLPSHGSVKVTFFGVSSLLFDDGETQLLVDGWFSRYPLEQSQTTPIATDTALVARYIRDFRMNRVRGIFVTHTHWDHAFDVAEVANRTGATVYGSVSTLNVARGGNVPEKKLTLFRQGSRYQLGRFTVTVLSSKHSPSAMVDKEHGRIIDKPMVQPAMATDYPEGGSYDFLISHDGHTLYVKPSANWIDGALDSVRSDVLFLGIAALGQQKQAWRDSFYTQTVGQLKPSFVIPLHWDDFFQPVSDTLPILPAWADNCAEGFEYLAGRTREDSISFRILQGKRSILLFTKSKTHADQK